MSVSSPYYFVPIPDRPVLVENGHLISHDVPFSDGISGWLDVELIATTPIFTKGEDGDFFRVTPNGAFAIPPASFRNMLRAVVEVVSAGKLNRFHNRKISTRDLYNSTYTSQMREAKSGWMWQDQNGVWWCRTCSVAHITHQALEARNRSPGSFGNRQSAAEKYERWQSCRQMTQSSMHIAHGAHGTLNATFAGTGVPATNGRLVFTGQPNSTKKTEFSKKTEFFFYPDYLPATDDSKDIQVPDSVRADFLEIHQRDQAESWQYWSTAFAAGDSIPVFYLPGASSKEIKAVGLAQMFRLPSKSDIAGSRGSNPKLHDDPNPDLAEAVFGYLPGQDATRAGHVGLKGRVFPSPLVLVGHTRRSDEVRTVLGSPKPSFFPTYLQQSLDPADKKGKIQGEYSSYLSRNAKLSGRKRYATHPDGALATPPPPPINNDDMVVTLRPLKQGSTFAGRVYVHNLRPFELGALVWAMTLGETEDGNRVFRHRIGMAKPYGFGCALVKIRDSTLNRIDGTTIDVSTARTSFCEWMGTRCPNWLDSDWMREFFSISNAQQVLYPSDLTYPTLTVPGTNEFAQIKKDELALIPIRERAIWEAEIRYSDRLFHASGIQNPPP